MGVYKCKRCSWSTTDESSLTLVKGCCGKKKYRCPNCGYSEVTGGGAGRTAATMRVTTGHGGKIVRKQA
jgi:DNA-directed RNA polymerase subunit RPC12/RpoP